MPIPLQRLFYDRIAQLTFTFPEDAVTSTGTLFWSAPKRFPRAVDFDAADPTHASYAQAASILRAEVYGIPLPPWAHSAEKVWPLCRFKLGSGSLEASIQSQRSASQATISLDCRTEQNYKVTAAWERRKPYGEGCQSCAVCCLWLAVQNIIWML